MGSWHMTCALSGLTLYSEEVRVGVVFTTSNHWLDTMVNTCNHDDKVRMVSPPLWGGYDGSGGCSLSDPTGPVEDMTIKHLMKMLKRGKLDLYALQEELHEKGKLSYKEERPHNPEGPLKWSLGYALVREDAWREMVALGQDLVYEKRDWRAEFSKVVRGQGPQEDAYLIMQGLGMGWKMPSVFRGVGRSRPVLGEHHEQVLDSVVQSFYVQTAMMKLHVEWSAGCGAGRQDHNHMARKAYFERMAALCRRDPIYDYDDVDPICDEEGAP